MDSVVRQKESKCFHQVRFLGSTYTKMFNGLRLAIHSASR